MTVEHFPMEILHIMHVVTEVRTDKNVRQNLTLMLPVFKLEVLQRLSTEESIHPKIFVSLGSICQNAHRILDQKDCISCF